MNTPTKKPEAPPVWWAMVRLVAAVLVLGLGGALCVSWAMDGYSIAAWIAAAFTLGALSGLYPSEPKSE